MLLLDTPVFVWWWEGDADRFTPADLATMEAAPLLGISAASFYGIARLIREGRLPFDPDWPLRNAEAFVDHGGVILEIDHGVMACAGALDWDHGDPLDRLIVATAIERGLDLMTGNRTVAGFYDRAVGWGRAPSPLHVATRREP